MFDVGFWEISLIMVVALVVIGPERLPGVARKVGMWVGKGRRFIRTVKEDIDKELAVDELRKIMKAESEGESLHEIIEETKGALDETLEGVSKSFMVEKMDDSPAAIDKPESGVEQGSGAELQSSDHDTKR